LNASSICKFHTSRGSGSRSAGRPSTHPAPFRLSGILEQISPFFGDTTKLTTLSQRLSVLTTSHSTDRQKTQVVAIPRYQLNTVPGACSSRWATEINDGPPTNAHTRRALVQRQFIEQADSAERPCSFPSGADPSSEGHEHPGAIADQLATVCPGHNERQCSTTVISSLLRSGPPAIAFLLHPLSTHLESGSERAPFTEGFR